MHKIKSGRPEWYVRIQDEKIKPYSSYFSKQGEAILRFPASQIFEDLYLPNGVVFASKVKTLKEYGSMVGKNCFPSIISESEARSINYPDDLEHFRKTMKD